MSFMLEKVIKCQTLIVASIVLAYEGKEIFEALGEFLLLILKKIFL
jgi:hypothetical protein